MTKESTCPCDSTVKLPNILYTERYMKRVLSCYESVGPSIRAKHKIGHYDLYFYSKSLPYIFKSMLCMSIMLLNINQLSPYNFADHYMTI